jgi:hypothetical protein
MNLTFMLVPTRFVIRVYILRLMLHRIHVWIKQRHWPYRISPPNTMGRTIVSRPYAIKADQIMNISPTSFVFDEQRHWRRTPYFSGRSAYFYVYFYLFFFSYVAVGFFDVIDRINNKPNETKPCSSMDEFSHRVHLTPTGICTTRNRMNSIALWRMEPTIRTTWSILDLNWVHRCTAKYALSIQRLWEAWVEVLSRRHCFDVNILTSHSTIVIDRIDSSTNRSIVRRHWHQSLSMNSKTKWSFRQATKKIISTARTSSNPIKRSILDDKRKSLTPITIESMNRRWCFQLCKSTIIMQFNRKPSSHQRANHVIS